MELIDLKTYQAKIDDIRSVIASVAKRSIYVVLDCRSRTRSFAMTWMWCIKVKILLNNGTKSII